MTILDVNKLVTFRPFVNQQKLHSHHVQSPLYPVVDCRRVILLQYDRVRFVTAVVMPLNDGHTHDADS